MNKSLEYFQQEQPEARAAIGSEQMAEELRCERWLAAQSLKIPETLTFIATHLGKDPASIDKAGKATGYQSTYGPKRQIIQGNVKLYWDGYGGFTSVKIRNTEVYSSHSVKPFIIPGTWLNQLLELLPQAQSIATISDAQLQAKKLTDCFKKI